MKTIVRVLPLAFAIVTSGAAAQNTSPEPQIAGNGRGEVKVKPTRATLSFTVQGKGATAAAAAAENATLVTGTMRSLADAGLKADEINNTAYSVAPDYDFSLNGRKQIGFVATNGIRVEIANIANIGKIIDAGLAGGATQVSPAQYSGDKMDDARRSALRTAVEQARRDAETMADAAGGSLGRLLYLSSTGGFEPVYREVVALGGVAGGASGAPGTAIRPTDLTVTATATGRWEFIAHK